MMGQARRTVCHTLLVPAQAQDPEGQGTLNLSRTYSMPVFKSRKTGVGCETHGRLGALILRNRKDSVGPGWLDSQLFTWPKLSQAD